MTFAARGLGGFYTRQFNYLFCHYSKKFLVKIATTPEEIHQALRLRHHVFFAHNHDADGDVDRDIFDEACDHLLVIDRESMQVIGTYRILHEYAARRHGHGFYTSGEYDLSAMLATKSGPFIEVGRSCVHPQYRTKCVIDLLWRGLSAYIELYQANFFFGCASFQGTKPCALALSYLYHYHLAPAEYCPKVIEQRVDSRKSIACTTNSMLKPQAVSMNIMPKEQIDVVRARRLLPPLIRGYIQIGCSIGDGAFIDYEFGSVDVCIIFERGRAASSYRTHYTKSFAT